MGGNPTNVSEFLLWEARVKVSPDVVKKQGLGIENLFDGRLNEATMAALGITSPRQQKRVLHAVGLLDTRWTWHPPSAWEWRAANLRLCDMWLVPMYIFSPSFLLIWSRYIDETEGALDRLDDIVDQCSEVWFWIMVSFFPNLPFYYIISGGGGPAPVGGFAGMVLYAITLTRLIDDIGSVASPRPRLIREALGLAFSLFCYHVLWPVLPTSLLTGWTYAMVYAIYPTLGVFMIFSTARLAMFYTYFI